MSQARIELTLLRAPNQHAGISATETVTGLIKNLVPPLKHWQRGRWHRATQRPLFHSHELKVQISQYACATTQPGPVTSSCPTYFRHKRHKSKSIWIKRHATSQLCPLTSLVDNATLACHWTMHRYESRPEWLHSWTAIDIFDNPSDTTVSVTVTSVDNVSVLVTYVDNVSVLTTQ